MSEEKKYKWQLRKGGRKMRCPACGQMRFVPYVLASDNKTLAGEKYGRCDRENNCGYHKYPSELDTGDWTPAPVVHLEPIRINKGCLNHQKTNLFNWAKAVLGRYLGDGWATNLLLESAWEAYEISSSNGYTVFPQFDKKGQMRALKAIPYKDNGHRDKSSVPAVFLHKFAPYSGYVTGEELKQCFFGLHLAARAKAVGQTPSVVLVESEKTALIMAVAYPEKIWLATGGSQMIKSAERCSELVDLTSDVLLLPDNGQLASWREIAERQGWRICNYLEWHPIFEGCDVLDYLEAGQFNPKNFNL